MNVVSIAKPVPGSIESGGNADPMGVRVSGDSDVSDAHRSPDEAR